MSLLTKSKLIKDKRFLTILNHIENKIGSEGLGSYLAIIADSLDNLTKDGSDKNIRTIEIVYNDFYSTKFDCDKGEYVNGD